MSYKGELQGTIVNDTIVPPSIYERFPTHDEEYGRGGYRSVNTIEERDALPVERLKLGCEVRVLGVDGAPVYYLKSLNPITWELAGGSVSRNEVVDVVNDQKDVANGVAGLDSEGKVSVEIMPDEVTNQVMNGTYVNAVTFNDKDGNPVVPSATSLYLDATTGSIYTWTGNAYEVKSASWIDVV